MSNNKQYHGFCETPHENCIMNHCDENGCVNRKRNLVGEPIEMRNNKQSSVSKYQNKIVEALKSGARLQSSEGKNYKCWLVYSDGKKETVRRDSANKVCLEYESKLKFGELEGVKWKTINISTQGGNNE